MQLLTKEIEKRFAAVGTQEESEDPIVIAKFFNPAGVGDWFAISYDPAEKMFFGYVSLFNDPAMNELGYFSLEELESIKGRFGLGIERDRHIGEKTLSEMKSQKGIH